MTNTKTEEKPKATTRIKDFKCIDEFNMDKIMRTIRKMRENKEHVRLMKLLKILYKEYNMEIRGPCNRVVRRKALIFLKNYWETGRF